MSEDSGVALVAGTGLPIHTGPGGYQPEGRGAPEMRKQTAGPSLIEKLANQDDLSPSELHYLQAALRAFDTKPRKIRPIFDQATVQTDATTGNGVVQLFDTPRGCHVDICNVVADLLAPATTIPTAPLANAASWCFVAVAPSQTSPSNAAATVTALRAGLVAFKPNPASTTGAALPVEFTWGDDSNAPIAWGGEAVYFVLVGGSQTPAKGQLRVSYRLNLYQD